MTFTTFSPLLDEHDFSLFFPVIIIIINTSTYSITFSFLVLFKRIKLKNY